MSGLFIITEYILNTCVTILKSLNKRRDFISVWGDQTVADIRRFTSVP